MDSKTVFSNVDIITELFKHLSVDSLRPISIVSKEYNKQFKLMSKIEYINRKYNESDSISNFIANASKEICDKYKYGTPKLIPHLCQLIEKLNVIKNIEKDIYLLYYWIILLVHTINNNYNAILDIIKKIDYKRRLSNSSISFFLKLMSKPDYIVFGSYYSPNKYKLLRHVSAAHIILFSKHQLRDNYNYVEAVYNKQVEFVEHVKKFEIFPNRWMHPKYFCMKLIEIVDK